MKKLFFIILFCIASLYSLEKVVILGGGVGGLTSGIYLARSGIKPIIIDGDNGSSITKSLKVENWPSEIKITGENLIKKLKNQAIKNGCIIKKSEIIDVDFSKKPFKISLKNSLGKKEVILTNACIIAMGAKENMLHIKDEEKFLGKGISTCATCDGALYKDKVVAVIGGGNKSILESLYLSKIAKKVYVILRGEDFRKDCDEKNKKLLLKKSNIFLIKNTNLKEIIGKKYLTAIRIKNKKNNKEKTIELSGIFYSIGSFPNTKIFSKKIDLDNMKYIIVDKDQKTSVKNVYAIGDIVNHNKQAVYASSDGAKAAKSYLVDSWEKESSNGKVIEISSLKQFNTEIKNSNIPVCIDFYSKNCTPCKQIAPIINSFAKKLSGKIKILKVNINRFHKLAEKYQIRSIPTLVILDGNKTIKKSGKKEIINFFQNLEKTENK